MHIVAVIPARGGSERVPNKNIRDFHGKPLIAWSIETALKSASLDRVIVSTDNEEIATIARAHGAEAPFLRPAHLAEPTIGIEPTLQHTFEWLRDNEGYTADGLMLLLSTSPARQTFHIDDMITIFEQERPDSVVAVNETPANHTPYWTLVEQPDKSVTLWDGTSLKHIITRSQDFPKKCYARNDLGYVLKPENLYEEPPNLYGDTVRLYIIPDPLRYELDINTPDEWEDAEHKFRHLLDREARHD